MDINGRARLGQGKTWSGIYSRVLVARGYQKRILISTPIVSTSLFFSLSFSHTPLLMNDDIRRIAKHRDYEIRSSAPVTKLESRDVGNARTHIYARRNLSQGMYSGVSAHRFETRAVFPRDRHTRHSRYPRARNPRSGDRYPLRLRSGIYVGYEYHDREIRTVRLALVTVCCVSRIHAIHCQILRGDSIQRPRIMVIDGAKLPNLP